MNSLNLEIDPKAGLRATMHRRLGELLTVEITLLMDSGAANLPLLELQAQMLETTAASLSTAAASIRSLAPSTQP
jgi:hypothetical protein